MRHIIWRLSATDTGEVFSAISAASSWAAGSSSSAGCTLRTSRRASASDAGTPGPCSTHSAAWLMPTIRGRNHDEHASGTMPRRANTKPSFAFSDASRMSIGSVIVTPTPTAGPLIAAMTGFVDCEDPQGHQPAPVARRPPGGPAASPPPPWAKVSPPPAEVGAGAEAATAAGDDDGAHVVVGVGVVERRRSSRASSRAVNALSWSGRSSVIVATWSSTS